MKFFLYSRARHANCLESINPVPCSVFVALLLRRRLLRRGSGATRVGG